MLQDPFIAQSKVQIVGLVGVYHINGLLKCTGEFLLLGASNVKGTYNLYHNYVVTIFNGYSLIAVNGLRGFEKKFGITGHKRTPPPPAETTRTRTRTTMMVNCITKRGAHLAQEPTPVSSN